MPACAALIVAAGRGRRFGGDLPKQYRMLGGRPVLRHSLAVLAAHPGIRTIRAVIHPDDRPLYDVAAEGLPLAEPVAGGETRQESVLRGLESLADEAPDHVLIHDGARPFLTLSLIDDLLAALEEHPGAIAALPVADTLKRGAEGLVADTVPRDGLWRAQTPQGFHFDAILSAHRRAAGRALTDDAAVAEAAGMAVALVPGSEENVKITTAEDLARAQRLFEGPGMPRIGSGFDVHRLVPGDGVTLCGVRIAADVSLEGHSDADVGLHALTDALLGAIGAGDIGQHFPPSEERWRGVASERFVRHAGALVAGLGGRVGNVDLTLICQRPRLAPHRRAMAARVAALLEVPAERVSIKATTTEGLGFTGRGEGIAAQASVLLHLPR